MPVIKIVNDTKALSKPCTKKDLSCEQGFSLKKGTTFTFISLDVQGLFYSVKVNNSVNWFILKSAVEIIGSVNTPQKEKVPDQSIIETTE